MFIELRQVIQGDISEIILLNKNQIGAVKVKIVGKDKIVERGEVMLTSGTTIQTVETYEEIKEMLLSEKGWSA